MKNKEQQQQQQQQQQNPEEYFQKALRMFSVPKVNHFFDDTTLTYFSSARHLYSITNYNSSYLDQVSEWRTILNENQHCTVTNSKFASIYGHIGALVKKIILVFKNSVEEVTKKSVKLVRKLKHGEILRKLLVPVLY
ncbi:unnamed protein product [Ambrosiozyma monospora]|uniref:Unnamed protein product n=1 Tax=Ambrosiozyma monospora TaxID=43982 RepID=A0ACB5SSU1_AMBMO|nr:unnamed protein product [Ambrosiozyma monospora]